MKEIYQNKLLFGWSHLRRWELGYWSKNITFFHPNQMNQSLKVVGDLSAIFPDIEGQLCSRHSILFGKLKNTFNKVYDHMDPQNYTIVKGVLDIFCDNDATLSMGLENGIILMSRQIDQNTPIYLNSNHFDEELIMTNSGKQEEGLNSYTDEISMAIRAATEDLSPLSLSGGILYLHSNIPQDCFNYKEILLVSVYLGVSLLNGGLKNLSVQSVIHKLSKLQIFGDESFLKKLFGFQNRCFTLTVGDLTYKIPFEKQNKMVLCQLDLAKLDIKFERDRKKELQARKEQILSVCKQKCGLDTVFSIYESEDEDLTNLNFDDQMENEDEIMDAEKFLGNSIKELGLLSEFNNGNISFQQFVSAQWELNSKYWKIHSEQVVELVEEMKQTLKINSCMIICETFALIVADKNRYTELLVFLRQKLHKGELKSKSLFKIEEELIQHRWSSDKNIGEKMFTSVPSCGVSIFDPSEAIWFD